MARKARTICLNLGCIHNKYDSCTLRTVDGVRMVQEQTLQTTQDWRDSCIKCDYYYNPGGWFRKEDEEHVIALRKEWNKKNLTKEDCILIDEVTKFTKTEEYKNRFKGSGR